MIRTLAITPSYEAVIGLPLEEIRIEDYAWVWVDFSEPTPEEARKLESYFHFHPLAVEDCLHILARPKLDYYEQMQFCPACPTAGYPASRRGRSVSCTFVYCLLPPEGTARNE